MKKFYICKMAMIISLITLINVVGAEELADEKAKHSYMLGMDIGRSLKQLGTEIDLKTFTQAISDVLEGKETLLTQEDQAKLKQEFLKKRQEKMMEERTAKAEKNKVEGEKFLAENKKKDGIVVTESGLQYEVLTAGQGDKPKATDTVSVHYRGTLMDGTEFDSSYTRGTPTSFSLNGVIPGWTEGLQLMPVGSKYKFFIPSDLAYGERGTPGPIGPNSTLIFEVELLEIKANEATTAEPQKS